MQVEIIYKGDLPGMPAPPDIAVNDTLLGKNVTAGQLEKILMQLLPE
ncbi:MAG: hypothetical protein M0Z41_09235 [Peptococcaceae bacterium]|nr:hypothetical protein [Peptococcaceae bacterium]